jgi:hypothetical protein
MYTRTILTRLQIKNRFVKFNTDQLTMKHDCQLGFERVRIVNNKEAHLIIISEDRPTK